VRLGSGFPVALSPDGQWVLAYRRDTKPPRPFLLPTGAGPAIWFDTQGIEFDERGAWFPDSKRVLLCAGTGSARSRTYVYDVSTAKIQPLTPEGTWGYFLSPDGQQILLLRPEPSVFTIATGAVHAAHGFEPGVKPLGWTNEPETIWVAEGDLPSRVSRLNLITGVKRAWKELSPTDSAGAVTMSWIVVSPDGQAYAYCYFRSLSELFLLTGLG
jgi:hypothetical protein